MSNKGLVPDDIGDFRSETFWQGFFKSRGDRPFEWCVRLDCHMYHILRPFLLGKLDWVS